MRLPLKILYAGAMCMALAVCPHDGYAKPIDPPMDSIRVQGKERDYFLFDMSAEGPSPLIIVLHGDRIPINAMRMLGFEEQAGRLGFSVVYPRGLRRQWVDGRRSDYSMRSDGTDDVYFLKTLIEKLVDLGVADPKHVFVTGISDGGIMAYRMACELNDELAGVAVVDASMAYGYDYICRPSKRKLPLLAINATSDSILPWNGGKFRSYTGDNNLGEVMSVDSTIAFWQHHNDCGKTAHTEKVDPDNSIGQTLVLRMTWDNCNVVQYKIMGGGHAWPGVASSALFSRPFSVRESQEINATGIITNFFNSQIPEAQRKHDVQVKPKPCCGSKPETGAKKKEPARKE